jgi:RHS repeat-associated protein
VRQYLHGDRGYDDPVEVLVAPQAGATPAKYFPVFDEAGTDSLQAVLDKDGNVVERVLYGDSFGDAPHYLQGPVVEKVTYSSDAGGAVDIRIHASEKVKQLTIDNGVRLVVLNAAGAVVATGPTPTLDADQTTIHWHLEAGAWDALTTATGATQIQIALTSTLRTYSWGDVPFSTAPEFARKLYPVRTAGGDPLVVNESLTYLASLVGDQALYEIKSLYMAGLPYSKSQLLVGFQALPYDEPANGLIFTRARWYDPATGTFLSPDPEGYHNASSLYAFGAGDPVNHRDPTGRDWDDVKFFLKGAGKDGLEVIANVATVGAYSGVKRDLAKGKIHGAKDATVAVAKGVTNFVTLGFYNTAEDTLNEGGTFKDAGKTWVGDVSGYTDVAEGGTLLGEGEYIEGAGRILEGAGKVAGWIVAAKVTYAKATNQPLVAFGHNIGGSGTYRDADGRLHDAKTHQYVTDPDKKPAPQPSSVHGNSKSSPKPATLYGKFDKNGKFLKWGISDDPQTRYSSKELNGGYVKEYRNGSRSDILKMERRLVERYPGPDNHEPWAGKKNPGHPNYQPH